MKPEEAILFEDMTIFAIYISLKQKSYLDVNIWLKRNAQ